MIRLEDIKAAWPHSTEIVAIVYDDENGDSQCFRVGVGQCSRLEKTVKHGEYSFVPYVRVWSGNTVIAEFNQHKLNTVFFDGTL